MTPSTLVIRRACSPEATKNKSKLRRRPSKQNGRATTTKREDRMQVMGEMEIAEAEMMAMRGEGRAEMVEKAITTVVGLVTMTIGLEVVGRRIRRARRTRNKRRKRRRRKKRSRKRKRKRMPAPRTL